jgi:hypothetical protein
MRIRQIVAALAAASALAVVMVAGPLAGPATVFTSPTPTLGTDITHDM